MKKRLVHRNNVNWGFPILSVTSFVAVLTIIYLYYFVILLIRFNLLKLPIIIWLTTLPILFLNLILFPVCRTTFLSLIKKSDFLLYTTGLRINNKYFLWKQIKSISFQTGRLRGKKVFFRGFKLPMLQKIFILDKKGKEHSCIIDIDYYLKKNRDKNNLRQIRDLLLGLDKLSLLSDWAEKR